MAETLLKNGTVIDPTQGIHGVLDLSVTQDRVAAIAPKLTPRDSATVIDATGKIVVPGLIDLHAHIFLGGSSNGVDVDDLCLKRGVTTAVDAGSSGSESFAGFKRWVAGSARTRVLAFVHLSSIGLASISKTGELVNPAYADPEGAADLIRTHQDIVVGLKFRASKSAIGGPSLPLLRTARQVADSTRTVLMVHIGDSVESLPEILKHLGPGDIVTHWATNKPYGLLDSNNRVLPQVRAARERGVLFDAAHGLGNFDFGVASRLLDQGFPPDTISTDLSRRSALGPVHDLLTTMTKFAEIGLSLPEVIRLTTQCPAKALRRIGQLGALLPDMPADVTVLEWKSGDFTLTDSTGATRKTSRRLAPFLTIRSGELVWPTDTPD